jgi:hypothetical protein
MGVIGQLGGTQLVFSQENVKVSNSGDTYAGLTTRSLTAGTYLIHVDFAPSQDTGAFPNSDPDPYQIAIQRGGTTVISVQGDETNSGNANYTNFRSASLFYLHESGVSHNFQVVYRQPPGDGDAGGMAGRLSYHIYRLMNYS